MSHAMEWLNTLQKELGREFGQPVRITLGGEGASGSGLLCDVLHLPQLQLAIQAGTGELTRLLVEARVLDAAQADGDTVGELWRGMLGSIGDRLGGHLVSGETRTESEGESCSLRLGDVEIGLSVALRESQPQGAALIAPERGAGANYDLLMEVELDATVRFGSREMSLGQVLELGPGDVVELDRHVSDPVDLIVGDKVVAHGEVVLLNGNFGLRITEVAEPMLRLETVRCLW